MIQDDQRKLAFERFRSSSSQSIVFKNPPKEQFGAAIARHRDSPKGFACFLSHHEQACAVEARLVKQRLESMLDAKVFLGKLCTLLPPSLLN